MVEKQIACNDLFLLVGSNPLPNFLATLLLKPKSVRFFYSPETEEVKDYLCERLKIKLSQTHQDETCIEDATDAAKVKDAFASVPKGTHLHYTGGTKIMAAHARMAFFQSGGKDEHASYLDERNGILRFDHGYGIDLLHQNIDISFDDILALHGIQQIIKKDESTSLQAAKDSQRIAQQVLKDPVLAKKLYQVQKRDGKLHSIEEAKRNPVDVGKLIGVDLLISQVPEQTWGEKQYKKWCAFLGGGWLEIWCGILVREALNGAEVQVGIDCKRLNGRQFEIDVTVVRGHRLYVISCTTETKIGMCKSKLFEVAMRARQLGGDLARSALVCLLHGGDDRGPYLSQLRNDVADIWDAPNTPQVFGLDDLREWAGTEGRPDTGSLREWLDS